MYYVLKDGRKLAAYIVHVLPFDQSAEQLLLKKLHTSVISVVRGSLATAVLQGIVAGLGFFLVGVPNAALWGSATMIASLIPILGTALTIVPAVLYLALTGSIIPAVLLILWGFFVVSVVDNIFRGQFMKKGIDVHPFFILLSVLGGLEFFGPIGFISGPLLLAIVTALLDIYLSYEHPKASA
jgi:predicted PurR-regulated permease PerM